MRLAIRGRSSEIWIPATLVEMGLKLLPGLGVPHVDVARSPVQPDQDAGLGGGVRFHVDTGFGKGALGFEIPAEADAEQAEGPGPDELAALQQRPGAGQTANLFSGLGYAHEWTTFSNLLGACAAEIDLLRKRGIGPYFPDFSANRTTMHLKIEKICPRFPTFSLRSFLRRRLLAIRYQIFPSFGHQFEANSREVTMAHMMSCRASWRDSCEATIRSSRDRSRSLGNRLNPLRYSSSMISPSVFPDFTS